MRSQGAGMYVLHAVVTAARLTCMRSEVRGKLRLTLCVIRTVRNGARLRRSSLDKVGRACLLRIFIINSTGQIHNKKL
ncbi:MAG: hypothetical protein ACK55Z_06205, partial [bacterium]